jgi:hypothetical protein
MQRRETLYRKLQSATAYLETIQEKYQDKELPLELIEPLHAVVSMLQEIRREILLQELTTFLHDEAIPAVIRNETVGKIFQLLV